MINNESIIYLDHLGLIMARKKPTQTCPYCRLKSGEYFTPMEIERMRFFCTNPDGLCILLEAAQ